MKTLIMGVLLKMFHAHRHCPAIFLAPLVVCVAPIPSAFPGPCATPTFTLTAPFSPGAFAKSVAVGDFNGDGKLDLAAGNGVNSETAALTGLVPAVVVLLGNGDGTFQPSVNYEAGADPRSVATGDFNGDGKLDLAVANDSDSVWVLLGNGDGTFQPSVNIGAGIAGSVAVGDFNGDGRLDLAMSTFDTSASSFGSVSVLLGKGDGTFEAPVNYGAGLSPASFAIGDFNGDHIIDLAVADGEAADADGLGLSVLLGRGDGTLKAASSYYVGTNAQPFSLAAGDFNHDGKPDLALSYGVTATDVETGKVAVLLGKGDGTFQAAVSYDVIDVPDSVAVGDLNGDGEPDLIVVGYGGTSVLLGNGDGSFQTAGSYPGRNVWSVAVGDFNNDSQLDLVTLGDPIIFATQGIVWLNDSCSAGPSLAVEHRGGSVTVSWPSPSAGYVLESATSLDPSGWKPSTSTPVNNNGRWEITQPTSQSQAYFRLQKP